MEVTTTHVRPGLDKRGRATGKFKVHMTFGLTPKELRNLESHAKAMGMTREQLILQSVTSVGFHPAWMESQRKA